MLVHTEQLLEALSGTKGRGPLLGDGIHTPDGLAHIPTQKRCNLFFDSILFLPLIVPKPYFEMLYLMAHSH